MSSSTIITAGARDATLVNVFMVQPHRQRELADLLVTATEEVMQYLPGFLSANIHVSTDGLRVVNYAQWESAEAFQAMLVNPQAKKHMDQAAAIAESFDPHLYSVVSVHHR